jgi:FMN phosphatase YigB (HAD superfamily)
MTQSMPPKAVVFDLGKVLLDFDYIHAARTLAPKSRLDAAEMKALIDQTPLLHRYESGAMTSAEFHREVTIATAYTGGFDEFAAAFGDIFGEIHEMIALQGDLERRGVPTFVFSNTNEIAVGHIRRKFPFFGGFTGYVCSYEVGAMKPLPKIYEAVERTAGLRGADLLYLDDRAENIHAGAARGWRTILHHDSAVSVAEVRRQLGW